MSLATLLREPGADSAAAILLNHHTFVRNLGRQLGVDLDPPSQPVFVSHGGPASTKKRKLIAKQPEDDGNESELSDLGEMFAGSELATALPTVHEVKSKRGSQKASPHENVTTLAPTQTRPKTSYGITVTMALGLDLDIENMTFALTSFVDDLRKISLTLKVDNNTVEGVALTEAEIKQISQFFFKEVFGTGARARIVSLAKYLEEAEARGDDIGTSERSLALASQAEIPEAFRDFFYSFGRYRMGSRSNATVYAKILANWHQYRLYSTFKQLQTTARKDPAKYQAFLAKQNLQMAIGKGAATLILSYLSHSLNIEKRRLRNVLQESQSLHLLACTFGCGILALVPLNTPYL